MYSTISVAVVESSQRSNAVPIDFDDDVVMEGSINERTTCVDRAMTLRAVRRRHASMV